MIILNIFEEVSYLKDTDTNLFFPIFFGFDQESMILAGISTWKGEEKLLVEIVQTLRLENLDIRLLIIPRHAERR